MILLQRDIDDFLAAYEQYDPDTATDETAAKFYKWMANNPQVVMSAGFQEFVGAYSFPIYRRLVKKGFLIKGKRPAFRLFGGRWLIISHLGTERKGRWDGFCLEALKNLYETVDYDSKEFDDLLEKNAVIGLPTAEQIVQKASKLVGNPCLDVTNFVSPKLWTPFNQDAQKKYLGATTTKLIAAIQEETMTLADLHWKQLEEIVAEVLRARGLEIHMVSENPQGGRDIIARGELIPGVDVVTLAVEVKHRPVVGRPEIHEAIHQNRHFPALMFVTSGRFSSGVLQEASLPENRLRLFLKDGVALRELIRGYGRW